MAGLQTRFELDGFGDFVNNCQKITKRRMSQILRNSVAYAATPLLQAVKAGAPTDTGALKKAIAKKIKTYSGSGAVVAIVGTRTDARGMYKRKRSKTTVLRNPEKYMHLVELGHRIARGGTLTRKATKRNPHPKAGTGTHGGDVPPNPFLRRGFESTVSVCENRLATSISAAIAKELS